MVMSFSSFTVVSGPGRICSGASVEDAPSVDADRIPLAEVRRQVDAEGDVAARAAGDGAQRVPLLEQPPVRNRAIQLAQEREREAGLVLAQGALHAAQRAQLFVERREGRRGGGR